ncbi:MAG: DNA repair protein RecO [Cycloclasticus sp.]
MPMNRAEQKISFILKSQAFKETSVIHQVFTKDFGVMSIISKGSRAKNSKHGSLLQPFRSLSMSWVGKAELKTLTGCEESDESAQLKGNALYCGFYMNELVLNLLHKHDAHPKLFTGYQSAIKGLLDGRLFEATLRQFEKLLFDEIGYGLALDYEADGNTAIQADSLYSYKAGHGAVVHLGNNPVDAVSGSALINLRNDQLSDKIELSQIKRMMRQLIDHQLDGKILKSRDLFV